MNEMNGADPWIVSISGDNFITRVRLFAPPRPGSGWNRTVETNDGAMKDEKTMKSGQLTRIPFQPRESADENRHVSLLAPFSPSRRLLFFPPSRLFCYFIRIHGKDIRCRPCRRARGTSDNGIIDRRVQRGWSRPLTIARAVNGGTYALDPTYIRRFDAPRAAAFHGRPRFPFSATAPQHHVRQTRRVICIKMESNTVRCEARGRRSFSCTF